MVCQNQSIDESDADLARDLRVLVRQRIVAGDTDQQVMDYIVSRYGEFVLLKPRFEPRTALLWGTPVVLLLAGGIFIVLTARSRRSIATKSLTAEEQAALDTILRRD
jgi:cytochrome c-type biogenesis protein CcmH